MTATVQKISSDQSWQVFDAAARRLLAMTGEDLIRAWDSGELRDRTTPELIQVLMLRPSGR